ncbi:hypothetical protein CKO28_20730 [Rhodovibrio sodomensis]|uniref:Uncharacterized protein n=2 Tax=Rhodovibrio sodomensis TaxID=1088 RepID=A0ABS1DJS2_9PROT|nr:hypothetical protein [Rhodovibrio sodomensis]
MLETLAMPFALGLAVALAAMAARARMHGLAVALGVIAGLVAGQVALQGWPAVPPNGAIDKLWWLALLGGALGLGLPRLNDDRQRRAAGIAGLTLAVVWIGWPRLMIPDVAAWVTGALLVGAGIWALARVERAGSPGGALLLLVGGIAAAGVAFYGSSYSMAQVNLVLTAALTGAMAGAGAAPAGLGSAGRMAAALPLIGLVAILAFYTQSAPLALILLLPVFLAEGALAGLPRLGQLATAAGERMRGARLLVVVALALVPACAAIAVAYWQSGPLYF